MTHTPPTPDPRRIVRAVIARFDRGPASRPRSGTRYGVRVYNAAGQALPPMPAEPTPDEVRRRLAEFLGWRLSPTGASGYLPSSTDVIRGLPDPACDLNAMATVEKVLRDKGLAASYLWHVVQAVNPRQPGDPAAPDGADHRETLSLFDAVTAPAAVRAMAAYRVLQAAPVERCGPEAPGEGR